MLFLRHIICAVCLLFFFVSCTRTEVYKQSSRTVDSLSGALNSVVVEFSKMDTALLQRALIKYRHYRNFIKERVNDTIAKPDAEYLRNFFEHGKNLEVISKNRPVILSREELMTSQLKKLGADIHAEVLSPEEVKKYLDAEKLEADKLITSTNNQIKLFYSAIESFKNSLQGVEELIKQRNGGELPIIVKDTVSL
jgi:hypothetical protein